MQYTVEVLVLKIRKYCIFALQYSNVLYSFLRIFCINTIVQSISISGCTVQYVVQ